MSDLKQKLLRQLADSDVNMEEEITGHKVSLSTMFPQKINYF